MATKIRYEKLKHSLSTCELIKENKKGVKNTSKVYRFSLSSKNNTYNNYLYYKIWPSNWQRANIMDVALRKRFYDFKICPILEHLIYDKDGTCRGYITKGAEPLWILQTTALDMTEQKDHARRLRDWSVVKNKTTKKQRKDFILNLLTKSMQTEMMFLDFAPSNVVLYLDKLSLIDLDSLCSFSFVFDDTQDSYENFTTEDWVGKVVEGKEMKTPKEELHHNLQFYKDYINQCLDIDYDKEIHSVEDVREIIELIKKVEENNE